MITVEKSECTEYFKKGIEAREEKNFKAAIKYLNMAANLSPDAALPYLAIGLVYRDQGKLENAINAFKKAIEIDPKRADAYKVIGLSYKDLRQYSNAEKAFGKALEFEVFVDNRVEILSILGEIFTKEGRYNEAIDVFKKALGLDPHNNTLLYKLGMVYYKNENFDEEIGRAHV